MRTIRDAALEGCYLSRLVPPCDQPPVPPEYLGLEHGWVYGWANIPQGRIVCVTHVVREEGPGGTDWLELCLPTEALERVEPQLTYPLYSPASQSRREPLDEWSVEVARTVAEIVSFPVALIGEEVSGRHDLADPGGARSSSVITTSSGAVAWHRPSAWVTEGLT